MESRSARRVEQDDDKGPCAHCCSTRTAASRWSHRSTGISQRRALNGIKLGRFVVYSSSPSTPSPPWSPRYIDSKVQSARMAVRAETASKRKSAPDQSALQLIDSSTFDNVYTTTTTIKNKALIKALSEARRAELASSAHQPCGARRNASRRLSNLKKCRHGPARTRSRNV